MRDYLFWTSVVAVSALLLALGRRPRATRRRVYRGILRLQRWWSRRTGPRCPTCGRDGQLEGDRYGDSGARAATADPPLVGERVEYFCPHCRALWTRYE